MPEESVEVVISKLTKLSKLAVSSEEIQQLEQDLKKLISFIDQIQAFKFASVEENQVSTCDFAGLRSDATRMQQAALEEEWRILPKNFRVKRVVT